MAERLQTQCRRLTYRNGDNRQARKTDDSVFLGDPKFDPQRIDDQQSKVFVTHDYAGLTHSSRFTRNSSRTHLLASLTVVS